eukprot:m.5783 g.5783  ORF g.5783 m.5783 type:complete len:53 (+) comp14104_c0_seq2:3847-4005(+)
MQTRQTLLLFSGTFPTEELQRRQYENKANKFSLFDIQLSTFIFPLISMIQLD